VRHLGDQRERVVHLGAKPLAIEAGGLLQFKQRLGDGTGSAATSAPRGHSRSRLCHGIGRIDELHAPSLMSCSLRSITSAHAA
jgi:hypothetical protein